MAHNEPRALPGDRVRATHRRPRGTNYTPPDGFLAPARRIGHTGSEAERVVLEACEARDRQKRLRSKARWIKGASQRFKQRGTCETKPDS